MKVKEVPYGVTQEEYEFILNRRDAYRSELQYKSFDKEIIVPTRHGECRVLLYYPKGKKQETYPMAFFMHGSGFTCHFVESSDPCCRKLADMAGVCMLNVDYCLAPEYRYPKDKEQVCDVISYFHRHAERWKLNSSKIAVCGDSAGANIATAVALMMEENPKIQISCQILAYPIVDMVKKPEEKYQTEGAVPVKAGQIFDKCYSAPEQRKEPLCSPLYASEKQMAKLPPAVIITCENDSLRDEAEEYGLKLCRAGVEVTMKRQLGRKHGFLYEYGNDEAEDGYLMMADGLKKYLVNS